MDIVSNSKSFYAHGKLLITAEYFILDGSVGLALPTQLGQRMNVTITESKSGFLTWRAYQSDSELWLDIQFDLENLQPNLKTEESLRLSSILLVIRKYNPSFLKSGQDVMIETFLEFPNAWGLGSSSTLISLLAQYAEVSPYQILSETIGGSGYDIACATSNSPILYTLQHGTPKVDTVIFLPPFKESIFFVYLGKKQLSSSGISKYKSINNDKQTTIQWLSNISLAMLQCSSLEKMEQLMEEHERFVSEALDLPRVKQTHFSDYWGAVKSLGAWGGDFVMMTNNRSKIELQEYLASKNMSVVFSFDELILNQQNF